MITPPLIRLPDPADGAAALAWLDANFVGQEPLDRFAEFLLEIERFRGAGGLGAETSVARPSGEPAPESGAMPATAPTESYTAPNPDSFDALPSATKTPAVRQALAQAPARTADATAFWTRVKERAVDRAQALAIIAASASDWGAALHPFAVAAALMENSAMSHWSALAYHGFTMQIPPMVQASTPQKVVTPEMRHGAAYRPRGRAVWRALGMEFEFIQVKPEHFFGFQQVWVSRWHQVRITDAERTDDEPGSRTGPDSVVASRCVVKVPIQAISTATAGEV